MTAWRYIAVINQWSDGKAWRAMATATTRGVTRVLWCRSPWRAVRYRGTTPCRPNANQMHKYYRLAVFLAGWLRFALKTLCYFCT